MKTELTPEQSNRLVELGLDPKLASCEQYIQELSGEVFLETKVPIFTLTDILAILPKEIEDIYEKKYHLVIHVNKDRCEVSYENSFEWLECDVADELIYALYDILIYCIDLGYCKQKTENKQSCHLHEGE